MQETKKEAQVRIKEIAEKIDNPELQVSWEEGEPKFKEKENIKRGSKSRSKGRQFELKVRRDLEVKGRIVDKWSNNVDLTLGKLIIAKKKFNPFTKFMTIGTGFPDFVTIAYIHDGMYSVIGVEVKINGLLSKEEKEKCRWYLNNKVFSDIWIASEKKKKEGRKIEIEYNSFREKYMKEPNKP